MELLTPLLIPIAQGVVGTVCSSVVLGGGGYFVYKKFIDTHPLVSYLADITEKSFSHNSLVSHTDMGSGIAVYQFKIPSGYSTEEVLKLKPAIEEKLDCEIQVWSEEKKFMIEVATNPIPKRLEFERLHIMEVLQDYECAMYLGKSRKGDMIMDFTNNATPHLLFGGPTGGGKSNLINQGLCGMLERYTAEELNLYLIDLKDGVELSPYQNVKHVKGFYETTEEVEGGLQLILLELRRRNILFKKLGVKKLSEYNKESKLKLPRILIVADEFAQFNNVGDKDLKKSLFTKWEELLQKGRSAGIHVMIGTQVADADVFPKQIKGNIDARFGFKFTDVQHSKMISGGSELTNLPNIIGRGLFKIGTTLVQTQTPYIKPLQFKTILNRHWEEKECILESAYESKTVTESVEETRPVPASVERLFMSEENFLKQIPAIS